MQRRCVLTVSAPDLRRLEENDDPVHVLGASLNLSSFQVESFRHFANVLVDDRVKSAFGKHIDQHRNCQRVLEDFFFRIHMGSAGKCMSSDDRDKAVANQTDDFYEQFVVLQLVAIQSADEFLSSVMGNFFSQR